jgi:hypothetical protein
MMMFRYSSLDTIGVVALVALMSISSLFFIITGQFVFGRLMAITPLSGYAPPPGMFKFLVLPVMVYVLSQLGPDTRLYRTIFLEELSKDYVRTARAKGLSEDEVLLRHVLRNSLIPIITSAGLLLPVLLVGAIVLESFFGIPGARQLHDRRDQQPGFRNRPRDGVLRIVPVRDHLSADGFRVCVGGSEGEAAMKIVLSGPTPWSSSSWLPRSSMRGRSRGRRISPRPGGRRLPARPGRRGDRARPVRDRRRRRFVPLPAAAEERAGRERRRTLRKRSRCSTCCSATLPKGRSAATRRRSLRGAREGGGDQGGVATRSIRG